MAYFGDQHHQGYYGGNGVMNVQQGGYGEGVWSGAAGGGGAQHWALRNQQQQQPQVWEHQQQQQQSYNQTTNGYQQQVPQEDAAEVGEIVDQKDSGDEKVSKSGKSEERRRRSPSNSRSRSRDRSSRRRRRRSRSRSKSRSRRSQSRSRRSKSRSRRSKSRSRRSKSRSRRSRSRSRSRRRSRSRDRRRRRSRSRDRRRRERSRSRDTRRTSRSRSQRRRGNDNYNMGSDEPNNTVMIRGLPVYILEQDIIDNILTHGIEPREVRLIRKKDTGESRGFAFVEFSTVEEATEWIDAEQGMLQFGTWQITMQYSQARQEDSKMELSKLLVDWKCAKCDVQNFKRREHCFKCGGSRPEIDLSNTILEEEEDESSPHPSSVLLLTNLDALTVEDTIFSELSSLSKHPLKTVNIARDRLTNMSRGVCYVEMNSVMDAMVLFRVLQEDSISIDGKKLIVAYKRVDKVPEKPQAEVVPETTDFESAKQQKGMVHFSEDEIRKMAEYSADLYAKHAAERASYIQYYIKYYRDGGDPTPALKAIYGEKKKVKKDLGTVTVDGVEYKVYPTPDTSTYQFDESSGYYFDPLSTLYYDANSQYYYNSKTSSFCYWDATHKTFLPAPAQDAKTTEAEEKKPEKGKDKEKAPMPMQVKTAKKIQKDMEKWAKTLNQKKNMPIFQAREAPVVPQEEAFPIQKGFEDIAFSILQRKEEKPPPMPTPQLQGLAGYGSPEQDEVSAEELQLTDWEKFACLLCKRMFQTKEKLLKHNSVSDLHKQNLQTWRKSQMESGGMSSLEAAEKYRDRAQERRSKFGDDGQPPPNRFKEKYMKVMDNIAASSVPDTSQIKISDDNVGNKMLQKMGWKEGLGLGKTNQGRTDIISTDDGRTNSAGLGIKQVARRSNDDYREAAKRTLWSRFNER